jgi:hypothetical protein
MFSPLQRQSERFPPDRRRPPTEADMRALRDLLTASAGDVEELVRWAECVLDTDDDTGAIRAYDARQEWQSTIASASGASSAYRWLVQRPAPAKRLRLPRDRYEECDYRLLTLANRLIRPGCSPTQAICEVVTAEWNRLGPSRAPILLGTSKEAVVARVFQRLRPEILAPGLRVQRPFADLFPRLVIAPRRARGVIKFGRPKTKF